MISWEEYQKLARELLERDIGGDDNQAQHRAVHAPASESQFLVAGPGSGKTTVMVLKILKYIYVDSIPPQAIMATTFTRKAASQLKSRIIKWGTKIKDHLLEEAVFADLDPQVQDLELEGIHTGTLDSLAQELLGGPLVLEEQASRSILMQKLIHDDLHRHPDLLGYLKVMGRWQGTLNLTGICDLLLEIKDRILHDQVDCEALQADSEHPGAWLALNCIREYREELERHQLYDFAGLEASLLGKLNQEEVPLDGLKVLLVDEYQDTNLLQESIYFHLARIAIKNGGNITVVGDDDQSLYRFRGATVDLFTQYQRRIKEKVGVDVRVIHLSLNYRSTPQIVDFCNSFLEVDEDYQFARVRSKPSIQAARRDEDHYPVLGMFRRDRKTLARDLSRFISQSLYRDGYQAEEMTIKLDKRDSSILMASPLEYTPHSARRFPHYLRHYLKGEGLEVFNPRGESLERAQSTELLAGLVLECLDPDRSVENSLDRLPSRARSSFHQWRKTARKSSALKEVVGEWYNQEFHLLELWYDLLNYTPDGDKEDHLRVEALTRTIEQASQFASYQGRVLPGELVSIQEVYWNLLVPLASGVIEVDEVLLNQQPSPPNRVNVMSIHQAKGLEFPLVVVDVGSDYRRIHRSHAQRRFPLYGDRASHLEDQLRVYSSLGEPGRSSRDRAFDDLIRQYYVAFSRAQDLLLLIGLTPIKDGYQEDDERFYIPNVATGWDREARWPWKGLGNLFLI